MSAILPGLLLASSLLVAPAPQAPGGGQNRPSTTQEAPAGRPMPIIADSVVERSIRLPSGPLQYNVHSGMIGLGPDGQPAECNMFYVAYFKKDAPTTSRPVTFCFNGGPGSATLWLHMGGLGPMRAPMNDDGSLPPPPYQAVENQDTWLDFTDLVFIDAPGTGFSRLTSSSFASKYFGVQPDIAAFTSFIKSWLTKHERWRSPLFIAGESYGGIRGSGLSQSLYRTGIAVNGFISISGTSNYLTLDTMRGNNVTYTGFFPSLSATAWYHKKLNARFKTVEALVKEVQEWIDKEYAPALQRGDRLSAAEKDRIATKMSEYLGISKEYCLGANLKVGEFAFMRELLRDERLVVGRLDSRITGKEETAVGDRNAGGDPSDGAITPPYTSAVNDYLTRDLGIKAPYPYLNYGQVRPWAEPEGSYPETASDLRTLLQRNPHFRVLYACGYYDLACPFAATHFTVDQMGLDAESRSRVSFTYYPAGHMMYTEKGSRAKFRADVKAFVDLCLKR